MIKWICNFLGQDKVYFKLCKKEITAQNNRMLINGSFVYACVLLFYTIITRVMNQPSLLSNMYYIFDVIHAVLGVCILVHAKRHRENFLATQIYCIILELTVLGFFALEAVFVSQTQHSLYVPIAILLILLLFIHKTAYIVIVTLLYTSSYAVMACLYKTPEAYENDIYIAVATFISAMIGYALIAQMRHNEAKALKKYELLSKTDPLTGLLNKSAIESVYLQVVQEKNRELAFIIFDLDNFKSVNDIYGHDVGDEVLRMVGHTLKACFREMDSIGRFGGDEFIVLMDRCSDPDAVTVRAEKAITKISEFKISNTDICVQCSAGIAIKKTNDTLQTIFKRADMALYEAKAAGKGRVFLMKE